MITVKRLNELLKEELDRIKSIGISIEETLPEVKISKRSTIYGCNTLISRSSRIHEISISRCFFEAPEEEIRTVIAHEVAHSAVGAVGHRTIWQNVVRRLAKAYDYMYADYHLNPHPYGNERFHSPHTPLNKDREQQSSKIYKLYCSKCGKEFTYKRKCKTIKYPWQYAHKADNGTLTNKKAL